MELSPQAMAPGGVELRFRAPDQVPTAVGHLPRGGVGHGRARPIGDDGCAQRPLTSSSLCAFGGEGGDGDKRYREEKQVSTECVEKHNHKLNQRSRSPLLRSFQGFVNPERAHTLDTAAVAVLPTWSAAASEVRRRLGLDSLCRSGKAASHFACRRTPWNRAVFSFANPESTLLTRPLELVILFSAS